jgi:GR25 family glycosyltransferase involved in LPS biosynthesis
MAARINDVFERVVVLSLDRRGDRMAAMEAQLRPLGVTYERFSAIDGRDPAVAEQWRRYAQQPPVHLPPHRRPVSSYRELYLDYDDDLARVAFVEQRTGRKAIATAGAFALLLSMTAIVERALAAGWASVLILEDDARFHRDSEALFARCMAQLPADWAILQLGAMQLHWEPQWISWHSENLYRCHGSSIGAHAVGLRREVLEPLRARCQRRDLPYDIGALHSIKRRFDSRCFTMFPNVAIQDASDSEIGMSTLFFREARKLDNVYRWHLPDYGLSPGPAVAAREEPRSSRDEPEVPKTILSSVRFPLPPAVRRLAETLRVRAGRAAAGPRPPGASAPSPPAPARAVAARPPHAGTPLRCRATELPDAQTVLVVVVGLPPAELEAVVSKVAPGSGRAIVPVFLTDCDAFEVFRARGAAFEYLPPPGPGPGADLDWPLYRLRRLALLRRKWQPTRIIAFGAAAHALVATWRSSPFEDPTIAREMGGGSPDPSRG